MPLVTSSPTYTGGFIEDLHLVAEHIRNTDDSIYDDVNALVYLAYQWASAPYGIEPEPIARPGEYSSEHYSIDSKNEAITSAQEAAASAVSAAAALVSEDNSELSMWEAEANLMTAISYADLYVDSNPANTDNFVRVYTSDDDGTFTAAIQTDVFSAKWNQIVAQETYQDVLLVQATVEQEGDDQVARVRLVGDAQDTRVTNEGDAQVARVIGYVDEAEDYNGWADAEARNADAWANTAVDTDVIAYTWDEVNNAIVQTPIIGARSSFHWEEQAKLLASGMTPQGVWNSIDCSLPPTPTPLPGELANGFFYITGSVTGDTTLCPDLSEGDWIVWSGDVTGDATVEGEWHVVNWTFDWTAITGVPENVSNALSRSGGTMTQPALTSYDSSNPADNEYITKAFVDTLSALFLPISGAVPMIGDLTIVKSAPALIFKDTVYAGNGFQITQPNTGLFALQLLDNADAVIADAFTASVSDARVTFPLNPLTSEAQNTSVNALTRKDYVDDQNALYLPKAGGTMTGTMYSDSSIVLDNNVAYRGRLVDGTAEDLFRIGTTDVLVINSGHLNAQFQGVVLFPNAVPQTDGVQGTDPSELTRKDYVDGVNATQDADIVTAQATADGAVAVNVTQDADIITAQSTADGAVSVNITQQTAIDLNTAKPTLAEALLATQPVGSVVLRMDTINPSTIYGGTWALITGDASLKFGDGTARDGAVSGSDTAAVPLLEHSHPNTASASSSFTGTALAAHDHQTFTDYWASDSSGSDHTVIGGNSGSSDYRTSSDSAGTPAGSVSTTVTMANVNAGTAGATMDVGGAGITINVWQRTA